MAFAGAATGAPAQSEKSMATPVGSAVKGKSLNKSMTLEAAGYRGSAVAPKALEKNPYKAVLQANAKGDMLAASIDRKVAKQQRPRALSYKAPSGLNAAAATAVATQDQPITPKSSAVTSRTGVNAFQQDTFGGYSLEPPDPSLCAGQGFVVQVVNAQMQISNGNLEKLSAPIPLESFFGDFVNSIFDPLCAYNHSTGRFYLTAAVSDFATFSGVYIAVSTGSNPIGPWNIYFLDLGSFGGTLGAGCAAGLCLADQPNLGADQFSISISTNQFDLLGASCATGFCGAAYVLIDKFALAMGNPFPNVVAFDLGAVPVPFPDIIAGNCAGNVGGVCWYSVQPAEAGNGRYDGRNGGTQWAMSALDFFGLPDNRIAVWQFVNTSSIGAFIPDISGSVGLADLGHATYSSPPLSAQPQTATGPNVANGNPLGDFLVLLGLCGPGSPPAGCGNPGPIDSGDDRMRDTMMTTLANGSKIMWGGLGTDTGGRAGVMLFGINLGSSLSTTSLARTWTIHNPSNDLQFPAVSIFDSGLVLAAYSVSGSALRPSAAYSVFSTTMAPAAIQIANQGMGLQDGFTQYVPLTGFYRPRWGDYSGAATMGNSIYFTSEFIPVPNCSLSQFLIDDTCGGTRTFFANWGTSLNRATG
jgi:hypothetical protein